MTKSTSILATKDIELLKAQLSTLKENSARIPESGLSDSSLIEGRNSILLLTHSNPDGDAIGSTLGFGLALQSLGFEPTLACIDPVPTSFRFLKGSDAFVQTFDQDAFDTVAFIDCGGKKLTRFETENPRILSDKVFKINIDHHPTNDNFGKANFVHTETASACEIVFAIIKELGVNVTPAMASALLLGVYTDTGGFVHQNTTPATYEAAAELVELGGNVSKIARNIFHNYPYRNLKLWGKVLKDLHVTEDGAAIVGVHQSDYESLGAERKDLAGVIDLINSMPEANYSVVLAEDEKGNVKASLRTRKEDIDVKALAEKYGGGGHVKASGFTIPQKKLKKEVKWKIV